MGRVNDTISNVNSAFRNLLLALLVGVFGIGGYKAYEIYNARSRNWPTSRPNSRRHRPA